MLYSRKIVLAIATCVVLSSAANRPTDKEKAAQKVVTEAEATLQTVSADTNATAKATANATHDVNIAKKSEELVAAEADLDAINAKDNAKEHKTHRLKRDLKIACHEVALAEKAAAKDLVDNKSLRELELKRANARKDLCDAKVKQDAGPDKDQATLKNTKAAELKYVAANREVEHYEAGAKYNNFKDDAAKKEEKVAAKAALDLKKAEWDLAEAKAADKPEAEQKPLKAKVTAAKEAKKPADKAVADKKAAEKAAAAKLAADNKKAAAVKKKADDKAERKKVYDKEPLYKKLWIFIKTPKTRYDEARKNENVDKELIDTKKGKGESLGFFATLKHMFWPTSASGYLTATAAVGTLAAGGAGGAYLYNQHTEKTHKSKNRTKLAFAAAGLGLAAGAAVGGYKAYEHWQAKQNGQDEYLEEDGPAHTSEKNESSPVAGSSGDKPSKSNKNKNDKKKPKKSKKWMVWAAVIVLALAVIGGAVYYFLFMTEEGSEEDAVPEGMDQV